jgi:hypothetical protein
VQVSNYWVQFLPVALVFVSFSLAIGLLAVARRIQRRERRTPLTRDLLRNPGESLREQVDDLGMDLSFYPLMLMAVPLLLGMQLLLQSRATQQPITPRILIPYAIALVGFTLFLMVQLVRTWRKRHRLRLGLECEMAVGQELNQLMLLGCRVYHDFPAEGFNIDHVVIGPAGVYAVETKGRPKPDKGGGQEEARVVYDGKRLQFPGWSETEPIAQARRQAQWLAQWLKSAVGEPVPVFPALALPGWYIDRKARDMVVFNAKNPGFLATPRGARALSDEIIQRVAHQVEQRCRTVEPVAYGKKKNKIQHR